MKISVSEDSHEVRPMVQGDVMNNTEKDHADLMFALRTYKVNCNWICTQTLFKKLRYSHTYIKIKNI